MLDVKLEILLRQWSRSSDVLFTVHPVDGSLLTWYGSEHVYYCSFCNYSVVLKKNL